MTTQRAIAGWAVLILIGLLASPAAASSGSFSNDEYASELWGIRKVGAPVAWAAAAGAGITIAIVDSGVDMKHEDLRDNVVAGYDVVDGNSDPTDTSGHGTHVAGIAAAVAQNGIGVAGVAPRARIMPVRVCSSSGCSLRDIEEGVRWAVANGADVVNISLGSHVVIEMLTGGTLTDTVNFAWSRGVIPVVSSGNSQLFRTELRRVNALIVTATTPDDQKAPYATGVGNAPWGIAAPGGTDQGGKRNMIFSTWWSAGGERYAYAKGTSMAAPHVAGAAAVLRSLGLTPQQTVDRLLATAKDLGPAGRDSEFGHGRLDVAAAVGQGSGGPASAEDGSSGTRSGRSGTRGADGPRGDTGAIIRRLPSGTPASTSVSTPTPPEATPGQTPQQPNPAAAAPETPSPSAAPRVVAVIAVVMAAGVAWAGRRFGPLRA